MELRGILIKLITLHLQCKSPFSEIFAALVFAIIFRKKAFIFNAMTFVNGIFYAAYTILICNCNEINHCSKRNFPAIYCPIYVLVFEPLINKTEFKRINVITIFVCFVGWYCFYGGTFICPYWRNNSCLLSGIAFAAFLIGMRNNKHE